MVSQKYHVLLHAIAQNAEAFSTEKLNGFAIHTVRRNSAVNTDAFLA